MPIDPAAGERLSPRGAYWRNERTLIVGCAAVAVALVAVVAWWPWKSEPQAAAAGSAPRIRRQAPRLLDVPYEAPGIRTPPAMAAKVAGVADDARVIGVRAGGKVRAYAIAALNKSPEHHIINDFLGGKPITVAHCAALNCSRAFTAATSKSPLDVSQAGFLDGGMAIRVGGRIYRMKDLSPLFEDDPPHGLDEHPCEVTTWKEWVEENPETDVYTLQ